MKIRINGWLWMLAITAVSSAFAARLAVAEEKRVEKPVLKITPGKVIIPFDRMRRIWGELISLDTEQRTGRFRQESTDEEFEFVVMPYAELLHHATNGDLQDFRPGERAIFRLHENEEGKWVWLTYIQDEMNFLNGHKEYYHVTAMDVAARTWTVTDANADLSYVRETGIAVEWDDATLFWKGDASARAAYVKVGDRLRMQTHGTGAGKRRVAWNVYLDDESLLAAQGRQKQVHARRMKAEGAPGYVDSVEGNMLGVTVFREGVEVLQTVKAGDRVWVAPAGANRRADGSRSEVTVEERKASGQTAVLRLRFDGAVKGFVEKGLFRVWVEKPE
jgi:hypothetical protein